MKTPDRHPLLDALSRDAQSDCAPSLEIILELAHAERRRRTRQRTGTLAAASVFAIAALWIMRPAAPQPVATQMTATQFATTTAVETLSPPSAAPASSIRHVNDQELLDLLGNTPAALVYLPDGRQRLMLLVATRPAHR